MSRDDLHFRLRIPPDLKERVQAAADANHRSMTAEIIARLEATFMREHRDTNHGRLASAAAGKLADAKRELEIIETALMKADDESRGMLKAMQQVALVRVNLAEHRLAAAREEARKQMEENPQPGFYEPLSSLQKKDQKSIKS